MGGAVSGYGGTERGPDQVRPRGRLTGGAVDAAEAVGAVQVVPVQLPVEAEFGELAGFAYAFQF